MSVQKSLKALLLLHRHGNASPRHSKVRSPSALSRLLNRHPWPTRAPIRLARKEAQGALDRARRRTRRRKGPKPRLLVVLGLVTLKKRGRFGALPLSSFHGWWGLDLVVLYLVYGNLRLPWTCRLWRGKGEGPLWAPTPNEPLPPGPKPPGLSAPRDAPGLPDTGGRGRGLQDTPSGGTRTSWFLFAVKRLGLGQPRRSYLGAGVGMWRDRRLGGGGRPLELKRQGSWAYLWGLSFPVWVAWCRYPLPRERGLTVGCPPRYSPHLNPMKSIWRRVKGFLMPRRHYGSVEELRRAVAEAMERLREGLGQGVLQSLCVGT